MASNPDGPVKVDFGLTVEIPESSLNGDQTDEELVDHAREILYSAPAFDGISEGMIAQLDVESVTRE